MRLAVVGFGKMGHTIAALARAAGDDVVAELDLGQLSRDRLADAQVAIEFTQPDAAADNLLRLAEWKVPAVCGTTGWYQRLPEVTRAVERAGTALVYAPNFSVGVQVFRQIARAVGRALAGRGELEARLVETHHAAKKDAPSGTAAALRDDLRAGDPAREYPITSIREGEVPGTHEILIEGAAESIVLRHEARDRAIFAQGALVAARWLAAEPRTGVYTFEEVLFGRSRP